METYRTGRNVYMQTWWSFSYQNVLIAGPLGHPDALAQKIKFISRKYIADQEDGSGYKQEFSLTPFSKNPFILQPARRDGAQRKGRPMYLRFSR